MESDDIKDSLWVGGYFFFCDTTSFEYLTECIRKTLMVENIV
jgi:hypothetical protein